MIVKEFHTAGDGQGGSVIRLQLWSKVAATAERRSHPTGLHTPDNF